MLYMIKLEINKINKQIKSKCIQKFREIRLTIKGKLNKIQISKKIIINIRICAIKNILEAVKKSIRFECLYYLYL